MNKSRECAQTFFKLSALWLFVAIWWGITLLSPLQFHNNIIKNDIPLLIIGFLIFIIIGYYKNKKHKDSFSKKNLYLIIPFFLSLILSFITIFNFQDTTLSFFFVTLSLLLFAYTVDFHSLKEISWLLFLASISFIITSSFMNSVRGRPEIGSHFFCRQISYLLNIFGGNSSSVSGTLLFKDKKITCDLIKLGFFPWLAFTITYSFLILSAKGRRRFTTLIVSLIIHYLYLLLRFAGLSIIIQNSMFAGSLPFNLLYWRFPVFSFSLLALLWLIIICQANLTISTIIPESFVINFKREDIPIGIVLFLIGVFFALYLLFPGFISRQKIHIVIDEIHSQWESTLIDFDERISGTLAENSYHSFLDYLRHFYHVTILTDKTPGEVESLPEGVNVIHENILTPEVLNKIADQFPGSKTAMILKCVTKPYSYDEIKNLRDFIFKGGCAFLIGDHTDVFFINKNLNELSTSFGIRYRQNSVYFTDGGWAVTDPKDYKLHPVTSYLDRFIWATGSSLELSPPAFPLIYSSFVCFADEVNYFFDNFFGNTRIDAEEYFGSFCIVGGSKYGEGKVVAFTDSTCFNNYLMFTVGRREFIAGVYGWFGAKRIYNPFAWIILALILCLAILLIMNRRLNRSGLLYLILVFVSFGCIIGYIVSNRLNKLIWAPPKPIVPLPPKVIIDSAHNPAHCLSYGNSEIFLSHTSYDSLMFNIGRIDLFPSIIYKGKITNDILDKDSCIIISCPRNGYTKEEKKDISDFVLNGGSLLLIEGANPESTINQIANLFDLNLRLNPYRNKIYEMKKELPDLRKDYPINPAWIDGGETLFESQGMPIISFRRMGRGFIVFIGDDSIFMKKNLAYYLSTLQCELVKALINKDEIALRNINWNYLEWE